MRLDVVQFVFEKSVDSFHGKLDSLNKTIVAHDVVCCCNDSYR